MACNQNAVSTRTNRIDKVVRKSARHSKLQRCICCLLVLVSLWTQSLAIAATCPMQSPQYSSHDVHLSVDSSSHSMAQQRHEAHHDSINVPQMAKKTCHLMDSAASDVSHKMSSGSSTHLCHCPSAGCSPSLLVINCLGLANWQPTRIQVASVIDFYNLRIVSSLFRPPISST